MNEEVEKNPSFQKVCICMCVPVYIETSEQRHVPLLMIIIRYCHCLHFLHLISAISVQLSAIRNKQAPSFTFVSVQFLIMKSKIVSHCLLQ